MGQEISQEEIRFRSGTSTFSYFSVSLSGGRVFVTHWRYSGSILVYCMVLSVQKVLSSSFRAGRLRLMGRYISHHLVARSETDNILLD